MGLLSFIILLLVGAGAGWLANKILKRENKGFIKNMVIGVLGAIIGSFLLSFFGIFTFGLIGTFISATFGAVVLLYLIDLIQK